MTVQDVILHRFTTPEFVDLPCKNRQILVEIVFINGARWTSFNGDNAHIWAKLNDARPAPFVCFLLTYEHLFTPFIFLLDYQLPTRTKCDGSSISRLVFLFALA